MYMMRRIRILFRLIIVPDILRIMQVPVRFDPVR